jgi:predicted PurR-regulated permease PerM
MKSPNLTNPGLEDKTFLLLLAAVSLAFAWVIRPFYGAVFWGIILAIMFAPLHRRLLRSLRQGRTIAALAAVAIVLLIVILPLTLIGVLLIQQGLSVYERVQSGELNFTAYFHSVFAALPAWVTDMLDRTGLTTLGAVWEKMSSGLMKGSQFVAAKAIDLGQNTFDFIVNLFIVLYLLFFFLRDGDTLVKRIKNVVPLHPEQQRELFHKFTGVIRATIKGNVVVAIVQGALGGLIFWLLGIRGPLLWAVVMALFSLLPAVGTAMVWMPVAVYFLVSGAIGKGILLIGYGILVIGLVDNVLRPILVGKDTKMPDYVVLISTLGGLAVFGLNGFVIGPVIAAMFMAAWGIVASSRARIARGES